MAEAERRLAFLAQRAHGGAGVLGSADVVGVLRDRFGRGAV
jgi:hypothetical protein